MHVRRGTLELKGARLGRGGAVRILMERPFLLPQGFEAGVRGRPEVFEGATIFFHSGL